MSFSKWETKENFREKLVKYNLNDKLEASGIPVDSDGSSIYLDTKNCHSLVIGSKGSGRHQCITLPMISSIVSSGESGLICDQSSEVYEATKELFIKNGYKVLYFDLDRGIDSCSWNPFELAIKYYNSGDVDLCQDIINDIGFSLLYENQVNSDPFWINSVINYFKGISLYCIKTLKKVDLDTIYKVNNEAKENPKGLLDKIEKGSSEYVLLSSILNMPKDTFMSVLSVFEMRFNLFYVKDNIKKLLNNNDVDLSNVFDKTIIYVKAGEKVFSEGLLPLLVSEIYSAKKDSSKYNIIISDFGNFKPIQDFIKMLECSLEKGICFTLFISGFNVLENTYGKEGRYCIESNCKNIIYLLSRDNETLEYYSKLCGNKDKDNELISVNELKTLDEFESVILAVRCYPYLAKLLPYYELNK